MKAKKIFGVVFTISIIAVIASTIALNTSNVEQIKIEQNDTIGVHSYDYSFDKGPDSGYPDEPIGGLEKGPDNGYPDEPIGAIRGPENGYPDEPIGGLTV